MNDFIKSFGYYCNAAQIEKFSFWAILLFTIIAIWLFTTVGMKIFPKSTKLKTVFFANRRWLISSLIVAGLLISIICLLWSKNFFIQHPLQLSLLISLTISMLIPIFCLVNLRKYYSKERLNEITDQPKTNNQLFSSITLTKRAFRRNKLYFLIPAIGFLFLLIYLNKGVNLISIVYDNSESMIQSNAIEALSETFNNLQNNNEITLTTIDGFSSVDDPMGKASMKDLMLINKSISLKGGNVVSFNNPSDAKNGLSQASNSCLGSPICESIWKTYLYLTETKINQSYKNKLLIVITDGYDNIDESLKSGNFFFDDQNFNEFFAPENIFIIDYSKGPPSFFIQRFQSAGCDIYPAENNKQAYLDALDNALETFKNNWFLIYWSIIIFLIFSIIGLLIQPKKIV